MGVLSSILILVIFLAIMTLLLVPVSLRFSSTEKYLIFSWMGLSVTKRLGREKRKGPKEKFKEKKKWNIKAVGLHLLKDRDLILELLQKGYRPVIGILRSASIREIEASFSTPDPLWNGVFYGILNAIRFENVHLSMNFRNINYVRGWLQFCPYKIVTPAAGLLVHLPYRRIIKKALHIKE